MATRKDLLGHKIVESMRKSEERMSKLMDNGDLQPAGVRRPISHRNCTE